MLTVRSDIWRKFFIITHRIMFDVAFIINLKIPASFKLHRDDLKFLTDVHILKLETSGRNKL